MKEEWLSASDIASEFHVSYNTGRRWIMQCNGDEDNLTPKKKGREKRPYRLRRIPRSLLEKHIGELLNG